MEWVVARWLTFVATMLITGAGAVGLVFVPRVNSAATAVRDVARDAARMGIGAALVLIPASLLRLTDQVLALRSPGDALLSGLTPLLFSTTWGTGFLCQCAASTVAGVGFAFARHTPRATWCWLLAALGALGLCATPALQGHAIGSEESTVLAVAADIAHVIGASLWLGTLGVIAWLGVVLPNADGVVASETAARADARLRALVPLVPTVALPGAALLLGSGVVASLLHLRDVSDLWREAWGRYVLAKFILACVIVALGALNWRRLGPLMATGASASSMRKSLLTELAIALLILVITAVLVVTPLPGESDAALRNRFESPTFAGPAGHREGPPSDAAMYDMCDRETPTYLQHRERETRIEISAGSAAAQPAASSWLAPTNPWA